MGAQKGRCAHNDHVNWCCGIGQIVRLWMSQERAVYNLLRGRCGTGGRNCGVVCDAKSAGLCLPESDSAVSTGGYEWRRLVAPTIGSDDWLQFGGIRNTQTSGVEVDMPGWLRWYRRWLRPSTDPRNHFSEKNHESTYTRMTRRCEFYAHAPLGHACGSEKRSHERLKTLIRLANFILSPHCPSVMWVFRNNKETGRHVAVVCSYTHYFGTPVGLWNFLRNYLTMWYLG